MSVRDSVVERRSDTPVDAVRGRWAVTAVFFLNGLTLASYLIRLPSLKAEHHLSNGQLGLVGTLFGAAALVSMQFVGGFVGRVGSARVIRLGMFVLPLALMAAGLSRGPIEFCLAVMLLGAVHGTVDVSMNAHAVAVERIHDRSVMSGCHAAWSISAVLASLVGALVVRAAITPGVHFVAIGGVVLVASLVVGHFLLPASTDRTATRTIRAAGAPAGWRTGWTRIVILFGITGTVLMMCDGAILGWGAIFLHESRGAPLSVASMAVTVYTACQTGVRLIGDRLKSRYGAGVLFRVGALIGVVGFAMTVTSTRVPVAIAGIAVLGVGASLLIPLTFSAVGHAGGAGPGAATFVSRFTTFTYGGILLGPALIGWVAQGIGLTWTLAAFIPLLALVATAGLPTARPAPAPVSVDHEVNCTLDGVSHD